MTWNLDMALSRRLQIGENQRIELRAEAFNVLNKFRPNDPNSTPGIVSPAPPPASCCHSNITWNSGLCARVRAGLTISTTCSNGMS